MTYSSTSASLFKHPIQKVWDALTVPEQIKEYFFGTNLITDWKPGSPMLWRGEWEGKAYEDKGTVLSFNPPHSLSYTYYSSMGGMPDVPDAYQTVTYALEEVPEGTRLTITQDNVDTQEKADHSAGTWKMLTNEMEKVLDGQA